MEIFQFITPESISGILSSLTDLFNAGHEAVTSLHSSLNFGVPLLSGILDDNMTKLTDELMKVGIKSSANFTSVGRVLGCIFALIIAAGEAYKVMAKGEAFDVLAIMRPILFSLILANWTAVCNTLLWPGKLIEAHFKGVYESTVSEAEKMKDLRWQKAKQVTDQSRAAASAAESGGDAWWKQAWDWLADKADAVVTTIMSIKTAINTFIMNQIQTCLCWLGELVFQIAVYFVFMVKCIYITVLVLFGPVYMACSILPAWKDAWTQWVSKMISVSLYGAMAYIVMAFSMQMITYAYEVDLSNLTVFKEQGTIFAYAAYDTGLMTTILQTLVAYLVGAFAMGTVFELASWVIPGGQASMAAGGFLRGMGGMARKPLGV